MITGYVQINLLEMIEQIGENCVSAILSDFSSGGLNTDIEEFLKEKAILFSKQGWAATHLIFASYRGKPVLAGYYTLAAKYITISKKDIQLNLGGKFVYLECEDKRKLLDFYSDNGFVNFGRRYMDRDEVEKMEGRYLMQMLKYIK